MSFFQNLRARQAISVVSTAASHPDIERASAKLRAMGEAAVPKLLSALSHEPSDVLVEILGDIAGNASVRTLVCDGLLSDNAELAAAVKRALHRAKKIDANQMLELYVANGGSVTAIVDLLETHKATLSAKSVLKLLEGADKDSHPVLFRLIDELATEAVVGPLIGLLKHAEWEGRVHIARTIARFPSERVCDALVRLLDDKHKLVRSAGLECLSRLPVPVPIASLCVLLRDPDLGVQLKAVAAVIARKDAGAVAELLEIMQDEAEHSRRAAVEVLNAICDARAIKDLLCALKDKDWWVRARAADALGAIGGPKVIDAVLDLLEDADPSLRRAAVEILNKTKDPRAFDNLVAAIDDSDWWVRERAIDALGALRDKRATPHLVSLLDTDEKTAQASMRALRLAGDESAVDPLLRKLSSPDDVTQREAIEALLALATSTHASTVETALRNFVAATPAGRDAAAALARRIGVTLRPSGLSGPRALVQSLPPVAAAPNAPPVRDTSIVDVAAMRSSSTRAAVNAVIDPSAIQPGQVLGDRYKVIRGLGTGAFGHVLHVEDKLVQVEIALKLFHPRVVQGESALARFIHEVRCARRISHENVIRIYDFLTLGPLHAISMEYFPSAPLDDHIAGGLHKQPARSVRIVRLIARAIEVAHQAGVIHRDVKPGNVLVNDDDVVKLVDFGISAVANTNDTRLTRTGQVVGSPAYLSPEQARGGAIDSRADIYSLGVIMYEIFTGSLPYTADHPLGLALKHLQGDKEPPRARNPSIPPTLERIILKAMALDPNERYQTATELLGDLERMFSKERAA
jgi:eukaryotic-like serine/threonine-protein kinase